MVTVTGTPIAETRDALLEISRKPFDHLRAARDDLLMILDTLHRVSGQSIRHCVLKGLHFSL